ncbi:MAG: hypothetical protein ACYS6K_06340 [Planctomycetota bacterium]
MDNINIRKTTKLTTATPPDVCHYCRCSDKFRHPNGPDLGFIKAV